MESSALTVRQEQTPAQTPQNKPTSVRPVVGDTTGETQQVCFMLAGGEYGVDISLVKEILKPTMEPTPVPQSPPFVEGVLDLRGEILIHPNSGDATALRMKLAREHIAALHARTKFNLSVM